MTTLLVDDDDTLRGVLLQAFDLEGMEVVVQADPRAALATIDKTFKGALVTDVRMPGMDGLDLFRRVRAIDPDIPVILMTGHGDVPMVLDAMKAGVFDFLPKPFSPDHLIASVRKALEVRRLVLENRRLHAAVASAADQSELLIGETPAMVELRSRLRQLAQADIDVLIEGETGTGKELAALLLHRQGPRSGQPFVAVDCAALPSAQAEMDLFGQAAAATPEFRRVRTGKVEASSGGTLFLDDIASLPSGLQGAFLRIVEDRQVTPLAAAEPRPVNLRIIAAANGDLSEAVAAGAFRKDLLYRLNTVQLRIPPLRERQADIPLLFGHFLNEASHKFRRAIPPVTRTTLDHLASHAWPGNVRELRSYAQRFLLGVVEEQTPDTSDALSLSERLDAFEAATLREALRKAGGNVAQAQQDLRVARNTFYDRLKRHGVDPKDYRS